MGGFITISNLFNKSVLVNLWMDLKKKKQTYRVVCGYNSRIMYIHTNVTKKHYRLMFKEKGSDQIEKFVHLLKWKKHSITVVLKLVECIMTSLITSFLYQQQNIWFELEM